jgi:tetratricopeptide (TPR) repeat protein
MHALGAHTHISTRSFSSISKSDDFKGMSEIDVERELMKLRRLLGAHYSQGRYSTALEVSVELQMKIESEMGKDNAIYASSLNNVGLMCKLLGDNDRAVATYTDALLIYENVSGKMSRSYMVTLANLGAAYRSYGDASKGMEKGEFYERAAEALGDVYQYSQDLLGLEHKETLMAANHLASLYRVMKKVDQSEALYRKALEHCTKMHGEWDILTATLHNNLGLLLKTEKRYDGATNHYKQALNIRSRTLGENHPDTIVTMHNIAEMHLARGETEEAAAIQKEIIELAGDSEDKQMAETEYQKEEEEGEEVEGTAAAAAAASAPTPTSVDDVNNSDQSSVTKGVVSGAKEGDQKDGKKCFSEEEKDSAVSVIDENAVKDEFYQKNDWLPNAVTRRGRKK